VPELTPEVMNALVRAMNNETAMDALTEEAILEQMRFGRSGPEELLKASQKLVGQGAAELYRRKWTWPRIAAEFGVNQSTAHRWAQPYLGESEQGPASSE
jgi:hypothetical protein